jgi:hypothetical protein
MISLANYYSRRFPARTSNDLKEESNGCCGDAEIEGMTPEVYEGIYEAVNFPAEPIDGLLSHAAAKTDGGMRIIDVWESEGAFEKFIDERLGPAMGKVEGASGLPQPEPTYVEVHNHWTP